MNPALFAPDHTEAVRPLVVKPSESIYLRQKKVMIICPWLKAVSPITAFCVAQLADKRRTAMMLNYGDAFVAHTRNHCVDYFLGSDLDWALWIDDDMLVPFGNAEWFRSYTGWKNYPDPFAGFNAVDRLMSHGKSLVGGLYYGKHPAGIPVFNEGGNPKEAALTRQGPKDLCKPTRWVGTGCLLTHRSVFEDIEKKFPLLARDANKENGNYFTSSEHQIMDDVLRVRNMLSAGPMDGVKALKAYEMLEAAASKAKANSSLGMGEDVAMCIRAKEAGHQCYVDLGLICGHIGQTVFGPWNTGK